MNIIYNKTQIKSTYIDALKENALIIAKLCNSGVKIELDAINNDEIKNCNIKLTMNLNG